MEQPKQYTPEEIAELEKSRTISDANLLEDNKAGYVINEKEEKENLLVTEEQKSEIRGDFESEEVRKEISRYRSVIEGHKEEIQKELSGFMERNSSWMRMRIAFQPWVNAYYGDQGGFGVRSYNHSQIKVPKEIVGSILKHGYGDLRPTDDFILFKNEKNDDVYVISLTSIKSIACGSNADNDGEVLDIEKIAYGADRK